ncbi:MAG: asparagine synthase (glutamine-hydrolyzing), partial [Elusimicrobiota bacterium]
EGYYIADAHNAGLAIRRLSIIDLHTGHQPIHNEDKTVWVVLNGEIYNYKELRDDLAARGHVFYTESDTEVIVHLWEEYREKLLEYLRGMFAIALWDEKDEVLFLARDRLGQKPLVYSFVDNTLIFASEIKALLEYPGIKREINLRAIDNYLSLKYIPAPDTIFRDIKKLEPAAYLIYKKDRLHKISKYWAPDLTIKRDMDLNESSEILLCMIKESIKLRLRSDVPLGVFLSGGLDSSVLVALMSGMTENRIKTYSIGFDEEDFSELKYARIIAERYGTEHNEITVKPRSKDILHKIAWHYDEPFGDSSAIPSYYVSHETQKHVKVALSGDAGDENFAGYSRYENFLRLRNRIYDPVSGILGRYPNKLLNILPYDRTGCGSFSRFGSYLNRITLGVPERYFDNMAVFNDNDKKELYLSSINTDIMKQRGAGYIENIFKDYTENDLINRMLYTDMNSYLPQQLLVKMDIASMMNSLEVRSPFIDHNIVEYSLKIPGKYKINKGVRKYILKKALKDILPEDVLKRSKQGFSVPVDEWFRNDWKDYFKETVLSEQACKRGYFNKGYIEKIFNLHLERKSQNGARLWNLLMLELWHREFIDNQ